MELFNVFWWDVAGNQHEEKTRVDVEEAKSAVIRLTKGPGRFGVKRVIITDSGDFTNFEWIDGKVTFPPA